MGRPAASPSGGNFENTTSPLPYANSPRSTGMVNLPSPQQQIHQQQLQQQQRTKLMQLPQHQQLLAHQQLRQSSMQGLGQVDFNFAYNSSVVVDSPSLFILYYYLHQVSIWLLDVPVHVLFVV